MQLMAAVDEYMPDPVRALDKPFSMPVEDVFSIQVRLVLHPRANGGGVGWGGSSGRQSGLV